MYTEATKAQNAAYYQANKATINAKNRAYYALHREEAKVAHRDYYHRTKDVRGDKPNDWRRRNPEAARMAARKALLKQYGITQADYDALLLMQGGVCAGCSETDTVAASFDVDHNHVTHKVRGLLCRKCNVALGLVGDDATRLRSLAAYLDRTDGVSG